MDNLSKANGPIWPWTQEDISQDAQLAQMLQDNAISPEKFTGTDYQKVQQALDYAITNDVAIKFARIYDITGQGSLKLNKADANSSIDRRVLYLLGVGGGIRKNDAGVIFDGGKNPENPLVDVVSTGDINVQSLKYYSVSGSGTTVWNADKIIRVTCTNCKYDGIDHVATAPVNFFQSMRFLKEHITGGSGWAYEFKASYDTTIDPFIESRQHGIRNTVGTAEIQNRSLRIINPIIENLSGIAIQLGACWNSKIDGGYFESNAGGHIDLQTLNSWYQYGLSITNNMFSMTPTQIANNFAAILWGNVFSGSPAVSESNVCNGVLHNILAGQTGVIHGNGDYGQSSIVNGAGASNYKNLGLAQSYSGQIDILKSSHLTRQLNYDTVTIGAGATGSITIPFAEPVYQGSVYSVYTDNTATTQVLSCNSVGGSIVVYLKNNDSSSHNITVYVSTLTLS